MTQYREMEQETYSSGAPALMGGVDHAYSELLRLNTFLNDLIIAFPGEEVVDRAIRLIGAYVKDTSSPFTPPPTNRGYVEQLMQLFSKVTWDGELICKKHRDRLVHEGLVGQSRGWNFITARGVEALVQLGLVRMRSRP